VLGSRKDFKMNSALVDFEHGVVVFDAQSRLPTTVLLPQRPLMDTDAGS